MMYKNAHTHTYIQVLFNVATVNCQVGLSGRRLAELSGLKKFSKLFSRGTISVLFRENSMRKQLLLINYR